MTPMEIELRTLTPLWTGGVDQVCDRVHETGLIGSLRWWYEALVRGLGGYACDPTEHACTFDEEKYRKSTATEERQRLRDAGLCDACQLFGATGWARRFRLHVVSDDTQPAWSGATALNIRPPDRSRGWFLPPGRMGKLALRVEGEGTAALASLFLFLEQRGNLSAKPQLGYGLFEIENRAQVKQAAQLWSWRNVRGKNPASTLPDLRHFVFFRYTFNPSTPAWWTQVPGIERVATRVQPLVKGLGIVPVSPALKNEWRFERWQRAWGDPLKFFGSLHPERRRSQLAVSWACRRGEMWEMRGWAWLGGVRQPAEVHAMLSDARIWNKVVAPGEAPEVWPRQWSARSTAEIIQLLEESV